jgi:hypothetical protein
MPLAFSKLVLLLGNVAVYARHPLKIFAFWRRLRYLPNVGAPRTKNEKFLWRKIFDRNPLYRQMADKLAVRELVRARCPDLAVTEIAWTGTSAAHIPGGLLRPGVVIKTNNGSDRNIFIAKLPVDRATIERKVARWLARPHGIGAGEWAYSDITPAVFIEHVIVPPDGAAMIEIFCFVAMGRCLCVAVERNVKRPDAQVAWYDAAGNRCASSYRTAPTSGNAKELPAEFERPVSFDRAIALAEALGRDCDLLRVDFMCAGDRLYFCECTVFPLSGFSVLPDSVDDRLTAGWDLRNAWFMRTPQHGLAGLYAGAYRKHLDGPRDRQHTAAPITDI